MSTEDGRAAVRRDVADAQATVDHMTLSLADADAELEDVRDRCPHYIQDGAAGADQYVCADCGRWLSGAELRAVVTRVSLERSLSPLGLPTTEREQK